MVVLLPDFLLLKGKEYSAEQLDTLTKLGRSLIFTILQRHTESFVEKGCQTHCSLKVKL